MSFRSLFLLLVLTVSLFATERIIEPNKCTDKIEELSDEQLSILLKSYSYGAKYDFGYTMAAIAWQESCAGEYRVNFQDPSAGIYHAYIPTVLQRYPSLKKNGLTQNIIGDRLINDDDFAASEALKELQFWKKTHNNDWKKIIKSYNRGYTWQKSKRANSQAEQYYKSILEKVVQFKSYVHAIRMERAKGRMLAMPIYQQKRYADTRFKLLNE